MRQITREHSIAFGVILLALDESKGENYEIDKKRVVFNVA